MPYEIKRQGDKYLVVNSDTGDVRGEHESRKKATAQLRALYVHVPEASKEVSSTPTGIPAHGPGGLFSTPGMGGAGKKKRKKLLNAIVESVKGIFKQKDIERQDANIMADSLTVFKDAGGNYRWVLMSSNSYKDREGEIVSQKSLEEDVINSDKTKEYGPLRWWHVKGMDIGDCDLRVMHGKVLVESGTFRDENIAQQVMKEAKNLQVSIGFNHPINEPVDGVYHHIKVFERSLLPAGTAANPYTQVFVKESKMTTVMDKVKALRKLVGDDALVDKLLSQSDQTQKELDEQGVAFKEGEAPAAEAEELKAKKKIEIEIDGEDEEMEEEEMDEEEMPASKEFSDLFLSDLTVKEFGDFMAEVLNAAFTPDMNAEATKEMDGLKAQMAAKEKELAEAMHVIETLKAAVKESETIVPRAFKEAASQSESTVIDAEKAKQYPGPHADNGVAGFFTQFVLPTGQ